MQLESLIATARAQGASDLHLEPGLPAALRVRGTLRTMGEPVSAKTTLEMAREIIGQEQWPHFLERRSFDLSRTMEGVRCRMNILQSSRGVGFAVRLLASFQASIDRLNLLPDLKKLVTHHNGLVLLSGPTGCGKSSTMAALYLPEANEQAESDPAESGGTRPDLPALSPNARPAPSEKTPLPASSASSASRRDHPNRPIEIEPVEGGLEGLIKKLEGP